MLRQEQRKLAELIKRLAAEPSVFSTGTAKFRSHLNDLLPDGRTERFLVCCVFEMPSFVSALAQGQIQRSDISRVEYFLHHRLGFTQLKSQWISETWAIAFGLKTPVPPDSFKCPHCSLAGVWNESWRDRIATCPSCNALIRFNSSLCITLVKRGWPKKRLKNRKWLLTDPEFTQCDSSLRLAIARTIENEELSSTEIAKHVGLDLIVGALQTEVHLLLEDTLNRSLTAEENVVKAILRSALRDEYVCFELDEDFPSPRQFVGTEGFCDPSEKWLAVIGSSARKPFHGLAFSDRSLHYASETERWAVRYVDLHQLSITLGESITELRLGEYRVIDLKGLGIPRRSLQPALSLIGKCIYEVSETAKR